MNDNIQVLHNKEKKKFYIIIDNNECVLEYSETGNTLDFYHTYVPFALRGQGLANKLLNAGAEFAKNNNKKVIPSCSYAYHFFSRHLEYANLI